ncbi:MULTISPECIES: hypothetical protein [unclassified Sphingomonas]|uniref:hypothetical protein n=1 Tax=unclassified Sphingomonas TaxID=196159 RepID=UPI00226A6D3E|nr:MULTISPECIES: hypothetical protein [unclassified Sphingomonas]
MDRTAPDRDRLFRYDRRIVANAARATFARWHDRALLALLLLLPVAAAHGALADRPWRTAAGVGFGIGVLFGATVARSIGARLAHHTTDGPLAADALHRATRWRYSAIWHAYGWAALAILVLGARPALLVPATVGYLVGMAFGAIDRFVPHRSPGGAKIGRRLREWLGRPHAGVAAGAALLLVLLGMRFGGSGHAMLVAVAAVATGIATLALTIVDDAAIRFQTAAGWGWSRIATTRGRGTLALAGIGAGGGLPIAGGMVAALIVAVAAAGLLLMLLRILTYRLHRRRFADGLVSVVSALLVLVGVAMPVALPLVVVALLWRFGRRASARTWLLT